MSDDAPPAEADQLRLDHFLKINALVATGGHAKLMIQGGEIKVNGDVETRRRRKLHPGDVVEVGGKQFSIANSPTGV
ncbi:MAG: RNA-binding S4 domain-containing protein [Planctomycetaceae bacterium]|nr:RNA-binding S4 domain-containing protein [Planctomycetaceae bacterium]